MTTIFNFNPNLLMEDCISKGDMSYLDQRNKIINDILITLDPTQINAPFPFVQIDRTDPRYETRRICDETNNTKTGFIHYKLREVNYANGEMDLPIPQVIFNSTIKWLTTNLWCTKRPAVHGDLTDSNLIYNPPYLLKILNQV